MLTRTSVANFHPKLGLGSAQKYFDGFKSIGQKLPKVANVTEHRDIQDKSRKAVFDIYWLRVATAICDYGMHDRDDAPSDSTDRIESL
ncbi:hypothetical protein [Cognatiyoonia sp. IB215182]|uniref:hypothetical protein n=1 Tax=Cognatiyoonia sp. IB215182 TaxID=3097353 RepID=UPI002A17AA0B|nr:hypothetical protein [Cognatiyoonia sp. IB215182]MDX8355849.1 hypothetical protein [Cognatiyoonia sp. IB215182]